MYVIIYMKIKLSNVILLILLYLLLSKRTETFGERTLNFDECNIVDGILKCEEKEKKLRVMVV